MAMMVGPMTVGERLPKTPKAEAESKVGSVMNPGTDAPKFTSRTAAKFKTGWREMPPKTPMGGSGGESMP